MIERPTRYVIALLLGVSWIAPDTAAAQVVIVDGASDCPSVGCPPCPPGMVCPPCAPAPGCAGAVEGRVEGEIVLTPRPVPVVPAAIPVPRATPGGTATSGEVTISSGRSADVEPPRHTTPSPGVLALGYAGGWDGASADVYSGGLLRTTGHLTDIYYLEITLGASGRGLPDRTTLIEIPFLLGFRIMAPIEHQILRAYGTLATGIAIHTVAERRVGAWVVLPIELGGGLEVGGPVGETMSIGAFFDVRAVARLPFEREAVSVGIGWSSGLGIYWF